MSSDYFRFKEFNIWHAKDVMKVGTDGVLVGAFVNCGNAKYILDIGTGTGLIALMLAQKSDAQIDAIDINECACELAKLNVSKSNWQNQIDVINTSLQNYKPKNKLDLIVSNPPFFGTDVISPNHKRAIARHSIELGAGDILNFAVNNLSVDGKLVVIYPTELAEKFIAMSLAKGLFLKRKLNVKGNYNTSVVRIIAEFSNIDSEHTETTICIEKEKRHDYSDEFRELTGSYYLRT